MKLLICEDWVLEYQPARSANPTVMTAKRWLVECNLPKNVADLKKHKRGKKDK